MIKYRARVESGMAMNPNVLWIGIKYIGGSDVKFKQSFMIII